MPHKSGYGNIGKHKNGPTSDDSMDYNIDAVQRSSRNGNYTKEMETDYSIPGKKVPKPPAMR